MQLMILFTTCLSSPICNGGRNRSHTGEKSSGDMCAGHDGNVYRPGAW
jgi:hypothetical protein